MKKASAFYMPPVNLIGQGVLDTIGQEALLRGFKKALIVTDNQMVAIGSVDIVINVLEKSNIEYAVFDKTMPNPTDINVFEGVAMLQEELSDFIISFGGGSPHDCAKGIALVATNGGKIHDYEGVNRSVHQALPIIAVNTTAGTASEMTRFCIITDTERHIKMAIVDNHVTPIISVNDPLLMVSMPKGLTAATGMDALTHAVEAFVSTDATSVTDACALKAIELIASSLIIAVNNGKDLEARENMNYAEFLAGMAFNSAGLGYVHAMAHQLGGFYNYPHGVCNAILLPHVCMFNLSASMKRFALIAKTMGESVEGLTEEEAALSAVHAIKKLAKAVGIPSGIKELGALETDFPILSINALKDACGLTNPRSASIEEMIRLFQAAF